MKIRDDEIAQLRRLVGLAREAHAIRRLRERLGELRGLRQRVRRIAAAHEHDARLPRAHPLDGGEHMVVGRDSVERRDRFGRLDRRADGAVRGVDRRHRERDVERVGACRAGQRERVLRRRELVGESLQRRGVDTAIGRRLLNACLLGERVGDRQLAARLAGDPLVGVEPGQRTARADVPEARRAGELRARLGEVELLRNVGAPRLEEVGAERDDEARVLEAERGPRHAVGAPVGFDRRAVGLEVHAQLPRHAVRGEPAVEEARERAALVLVEEDRVGGRRPRLGERLAQPRDGVVPRDRLPRAVFLHHRRAKAVRIVETLQRRLAARAERAVVQWVIRISFELDRAPVARLDDEPAAGRALAAGGGEVRRDARDGLVGRMDIWNELSGILGQAARGGERGARRANDLEKVAALDGRHFCVVAHLSSGSWRSRSALSCARPS